MLEFQKLERSVKTASVWQVRQPVYKSSTERWMRCGEALEPLEAVLKGEQPGDPEALEQPAVPPGLFTAAMAQLQAGQPKQAEALLRQLLAERPEHAAAHHFLGAALAQQGQLQEAREEMRRSLALHPFQPSWLGNLA